MARKRTPRSEGTVVVLEHDSRVLRGNPLGERAARLIHERKMARSVGGSG